MSAEENMPQEEGELWRLISVLLHWESQKRKTYKQTSEESICEQPGIGDLRARIKQLETEVGEKRTIQIRKDCMKYYMAVTLAKASMAKNKASLYTAPAQPSSDIALDQLLSGQPLITSDQPSSDQHIVSPEEIAEDAAESATSIC